MPRFGGVFFGPKYLLPPLMPVICRRACLRLRGRELALV